MVLEFDRRNPLAAASCIIATPNLFLCASISDSGIAEPPEMISRREEISRPGSRSRQRRMSAIALGEADMPSPIAFALPRPVERDGCRTTVDNGQQGAMTRRVGVAGDWVPPLHTAPAADARYCRLGPSSLSIHLERAI